MKLNVKTEFRDKFTGKLYQPGETIEIEDETRVEDLKNRGLAEPVEEKKTGITLFEKEFEKKALVDALKAVGSKATGNMGEATLLGLVSELNEEATIKLKETLGV